MLKGNLCAKFNADASDMVSGKLEILRPRANLTNVHWWATADPNLYDVYTILKIDDKVVDVCQTRTGFRKVEFKGGAGTGGVYLNDKFVYLTGIRSAFE
jgi:beta-galactosidase